MENRSCSCLRKLEPWWKHLRELWPQSGEPGYRCWDLLDKFLNFSQLRFIYCEMHMTCPLHLRCWER